MSRSQVSIEKSDPAYNSLEDPDAEFGGTEARRALEKKLVRKVDIRISILIIIYILNYVDRSNISAARLKGLESDLHLEGQQYATLLSILYVGYIIMQVPSNMLLNWIGKPSIYLPCCMVVWGTISVLTGITHNFVGALLARFFLGFVEAAFYPGALFLLSKWYKKEEIGIRTTILYLGNITSSAFGSLMASGILNGMNGVLGHAAWRWLFYIEGALTIFFAILAVFILPDFPATSKFLTPLERKLAMKRMEEDAGVGDQDETESGGMIRGLFLAVTDWRMWLLAFGLTSEIIALSFNAYFPTLTATLGFSDSITLLLCAPPWILTAIVAFFWSRHSDRTQERCFHIIIPFSVGILGFVIASATEVIAARYISLFLMALSACGFPVLYAWIPSCFPRPPTKRAVSIAAINAFSQLGNVSGSYVFPSSWGPTYRFSYAICIATAGLAIIVCLFFRWHLSYLNKQFDKAEREGEKTNRFRYVL
ncbi:MFS general substrate transporter [Gymnopus androsaceus JB14]|uniref:MFS general substrate transporter n=1 Tax=Gymnopus androsaceus JB14 TaxID=1447944 RepID=A0A6A4HVK5_9AGAR|nr:MFS general substrate transporter [Gymnopus androsaceus JB14]